MITKRALMTTTHKGLFIERSGWRDTWLDRGLISYCLFSSTVGWKEWLQTGCSWEGWSKSVRELRALRPRIASTKTLQALMAWHTTGWEMISALACGVDGCAMTCLSDETQG